MMPVIAARIVPMMVTPERERAGHALEQHLHAVEQVLAMPLRSIITPMKMNVGIATSTRFSAAWPQMRGTKSKNCTSLNDAEEDSRAGRRSARARRG